MTYGAVFRCRKYVRYLNSSVYRFNKINRKERHYGKTDKDRVGR